MPKDEKTKTQITESSIVVNEPETTSAPAAGKPTGAAPSMGAEQLRLHALDLAVTAHQPVPLPDHAHVVDAAAAFYEFLKGDTSG